MRLEWRGMHESEKAGMGGKRGSNRRGIKRAEWECGRDAGW